ncbi:ribonuclease HII [Paracrocinitomix mangrovi]|uniref:ribonuclease HII n=1 Tax=Paracrocinitomix mangrovi TaxID=2862509 RepID=UPI001EDC61EC|nr:ribonuclease HII [Paracrocinitomix mangrovi]UKN01226.1 ribonuclease HII [Paracrocinitomix mangrovi]
MKGKTSLKKRFSSDKIEAGCDEAGRGCLAGPVVAAAVILPDNFSHKLLNDSKKMTDIQRNNLFPIIKKHALAFGVGIVDNQEIDQINILNASFLAMHRAIDQLSTIPELLLIDGNRFNPYKNIAHECIIKGDGKFRSIAAASVLAKVTRDRLMEEAAEKYPQYDWKNNKGYPTTKHRQAIFKHGATDLHRMSFKLLPDEQLKLPL